LHVQHEDALMPYVGFKKLTAKLKRKGVRDPKALAAWIGRKKYGKGEMTRRAKAGKRVAS